MATKRKFKAKPKTKRKKNKLVKFSRKKIAKDVSKTVKSAISNAENNYQYDIDNLFVKEAFVGKGMVMKRFHARARGRGARIIKPFSHLTILLSEKEGN